MSTTAANSSSLVAMANSPGTLDIGYGRARLRLGIFGVGLWVVISAMFLLIDAAERVRQQLPDDRLRDIVMIVLLLIFYVLVQLPFDWFGGHRTPKQFGRRTQAAGPYALTLLRGVTVHTALLCISMLALYFGGVLAGITGAFIAGLLWLITLASTRGVLAQLVARLRPATSIRDMADTELMGSDDEGFTGGITGLIRPRTNILAAHWRNHLSPQTFELAMARRQQVMRSNAWLQGRLGAFAFTALGLLAALLLSDPEQAGTGVGIVETILWFTLWSFAGLLILPTLSRSAVHHIDQHLITSGTDPESFSRFVAALDQLQDGEPVRPGLIEIIFHPIPSVSKRQNHDRPIRFVFWDIARTTVYFSIAGGSLLTRSVHCNVGWPARWVWLPTD